MSLDSTPFAPSLYAEGFQIDGWVVRPRAHELVRGDEVVRIEPKPMAVLVCLAEQAGYPVSRDALLSAVWPDVFVSESTLSRCVSQLRKVLGDDPHAPRVIETIPKAGYRLIAPVVPLTEGDGLAPVFERHLALDLAAPLPISRDEALVSAASSWRVWSLAAISVALVVVLGWVLRGELGGAATIPLEASVVGSNSHNE